MQCAPFFAVAATRLDHHSVLFACVAMLLSSRLLASRFLCWLYTGVVLDSVSVVVFGLTAALCSGTLLGGDYGGERWVSGFAF